MKNDKQAEPTTTNGSKKPYQQPELQVYGNLRDITQAVGVMGAKDGGGGSNQKTH